jgi:hypothetical protein
MDIVCCRIWSCVDLHICLESVLALYILYICACGNFVMLVKIILSIHCFLSGI